MRPSRSLGCVTCELETSLAFANVSNEVIVPGVAYTIFNKQVNKMLMKYIDQLELTIMETSLVDKSVALQVLP